VPAEELDPGPCGYRVNVIDYDATANVLYRPAVLPPAPEVRQLEPGRQAAQQTLPPDSAAKPRPLVEDPAFHAQNVYAIIMRTLARFEFALGRRVAWGSDGHQIHVAPHAFAEANAFYSREDRGIFFGYFADASGGTVFTCLSHDVVAHETAHAILDGLRSRYLEPSSPDQGAFHEGFADVVALLSVFSLPEVVGALLDHGESGSRLIDESALTREALCNSVLLGLAEQMGQELSKMRGQALRRSVKLPPGRPYMTMPQFMEEHRRGELIVAAVMNAFLDIWLSRLERIGFIEAGKRDRRMVVEQGAHVADHLLTMAIRAIDYCPPTDLTFSDYLSALLTVDLEVVPDDSRYGYREALLKNFKDFGIEPAADAGRDGAWRRFDKKLVYSRSHFDSMLRDPEEVFRFLWENRKALKVDDNGYLEIQSVRPCTRIGPDGFILRETVAEYVQILTLEAQELKTECRIAAPEGLPHWKRVRLFGGGALIFDEYGQLKHQISNHIDSSREDVRRQTARLQHLWDIGFFDAEADSGSRIAALHLARAVHEGGLDTDEEVGS
jgi:hypothetical protein